MHGLSMSESYLPGMLSLFLGCSAGYRVVFRGISLLLFAADLKLAAQKEIEARARER